MCVGSEVQGADCGLPRPDVEADDMGGLAESISDLPAIFACFIEGFSFFGESSE